MRSLAFVAFVNLGYHSDVVTAIMTNGTWRQVFNLPVFRTMASWKLAAKSLLGRRNLAHDTKADVDMT